MLSLVAYSVARTTASVAAGAGNNVTWQTICWSCNDIMTLCTDLQTEW